MDLERIQQALREEGVAGWLFFDHHLRDPLAYRVLGLSMEAVVTRRWYYLIPAQNDPAGLVHTIETGVLAGLPGKITAYSGWSSQASQLDRLLAPLAGKKVAMQYSQNCAIPYVSMVDAGTVELIRSFGVEVVSSANLIQLFEARWTAEQLAMHLEAGRRVDAIRAAAFNRIASAVRSGETITEWDINRFVRFQFEASGLVTDHGPIVAVNEHMSDPHYEPSSSGSAQIRRGDAVLLDMWAKLAKPHAVYYDITWTAFCGEEAPGEISRVFDVVRTARDRAVGRVQEAMRGGETLRGFQVDDASRTYIREQGCADKFVHRTGHSIGEEVHGTGANMDNLETHDERLIIPRTCFSIEPGVYLPRFGIRSEVNVYVDERDARVTGEAQKQLLTLLP